jgi:hypothetical protein
MKKIFLICLCLSTFLFFGMGFLRSPKQNNTPDRLSVISCPVENNSGTAQANIPMPPSATRPTVVMVRKNIYSLTAAEINSIAAGVTAMKNLPLTNTSSWQYQAAIHWTTLQNNLPHWKSCQHGTLYFFSWHRMYLYFFEKILRARSGNPNLTLPYWDYQTNPVLPPAYRNTSSTLYDGTRFNSINSGGALGSGPMVAIDNALNNNVAFYNFQTAIEGPHGSIHVAIGGNMGQVPTAALDPCFWLHHANIDRLWEKWIRKCGGRTNPADKEWLGHVFTFYDENGAEVNMTGSQIVNTATQLNYKYDFPPMIRCDLKIFPWKYAILKLIRIPLPDTIKNFTKVNFRNAQTDSLSTFVNSFKTEKFKFSKTGVTDKLYVHLENVQVSKNPEGVIEMYLNMPKGVTPDPHSKYFTGVLDLFTLSMSSSDHHMDNMKDLSIDVSEVASKLGITIPQLKNAELTFFVRGNTLRGKPVSTNATFHTSGASFVLHHAQEQ